MAAMKSKPFLTLDDARTAAAAAEAEALNHGWAVTIAITDDGGHLLWLQRLDGAAPISAEIAVAKARAAALGRRETKGYEDMINQGAPPSSVPRCCRACWRAACRSWPRDTVWGRWA